MWAHPGDRACPKLGGVDGVADGDVSVGGEHHEEEGAGDLVDGGGGEVDLAHGGAKRPLPHEHCDDKEGNPNKEALVSHRKVEDVSVCYLQQIMQKSSEGMPMLVYRVHF